jgi:predicted permease
MISATYLSQWIALSTSAVRNLLQDLRFGLRVLSGSPSFSIIAILTLGLGIAATSTVFSWVDSILLHPYSGAARTHEIVAFEAVNPKAPNGGINVSWLDYRDFRDNFKSLSGLALYRQCAFTLGGDGPGDSRLAWGELVTSNYFDVMGVKPVAGRMFAKEKDDDAPGSQPVAVISANMWRKDFHSDPNIAGRTIRVNRQTLTIAGVAPDEFHGTSSVMRYDLWIPLTMGAALGSVPQETFTARDRRGMLNGIARLAPNARVEQARAEAVTLAAGLAASHPKTNRGIGATVLAPSEEHNGVNEYLRTPLTILLAVSFLVLLIVCANVANLLLARSVGRQREFGIRIALGAARSRVAVIVVLETLLLSAAGACVGFLTLVWTQGSLPAMVPSMGLPISMALIVNGRIIAFTAAACVIAALISAASPALFVFKSNLNGVLKEGSRTDTARVASRRTRSALVIGEVALATVALVGAGLFIRSFHNIRSIQPGFEPEKVLLGRFLIETAGFSNNGQLIQQFANRLKDHLLQESGPEGVAAVSYTDFVPLSTTAGPYNFIQVDGYTPSANTVESMNVNRALVSPGYFETMGIPLVDGRDFTLQDTRETDGVIIVNQTFANRYFFGANPMGRIVRVGSSAKPFKVIGVARDSKYFSPAEAAAPHFYLAMAQFYNSSPELYFLVRGRNGTSALAPLLRRTVLETEPNASALHAVPLSEYTKIVTFGQMIAANLMGTLGLLCLALAASGLYSVMSYTVIQRIPEIGIRMAMGARPRNVIAMIVGQGMSLVVAGVAIGTLAALVVTRLIATNLLYHVDHADPATFTLAALFLAVVALVATWLPAFRATRVDPMVALKG